MATREVHPRVCELQARHRDLPREAVQLPDGVTVELSAGGQDTLVRAIIEEFAPRFIRKPKVLLLGDAADKEVLSDEPALAELGVSLPPRGKAPDVLIHDRGRNWLIVIEAVTSHGPVDQKRKNELEHLFASARSGLVFIFYFGLSGPEDLHGIPSCGRLGNRDLDCGIAGSHDPLQWRAIPGALFESLRVSPAIHSGSTRIPQ